MKTLFIQTVQKRNSGFELDKTIDTTMLLNFTWDTALRMCRGLKLLLKGRNPHFAMLGKGVKFSHFNRITFGAYLKLGEGVRVSGLGKSGVKLGEKVGIGAYSRVIASTSLSHIGEGIEIGNNVGIGEFAYLGGGGGLKIGDDCIVGQYFSCHPENHNYTDPTLPIRLQGVNRKGIEIGRDCWIGSKVTILDGARIGNHCVIAAGAVVTGTFPDHSIIGGIPAKILKSIA